LNISIYLLRFSAVKYLLLTKRIFGLFNHIIKSWIMKKNMLLITVVLFAFFSFAQEPLPGKAVFSIVSVKDTVRFVSQYGTDTSNVRHLWLFGDGRISEQTAPVHVYTDCGIYKVKHFWMLMDANGAVARTDSFMAEVKTDCPMVCTLKPSFRWQQYKYDPLTEQVLGGTTVFFTNTTPGGLPKGAKFNWYVDGQSYSPDWDPRIDFPHGGQFTVCLRITLLNGCEVKYCARIGVADL